MKRMKKILSVLLSVVMVLAMGVTAFADASEDSDTESSNTYSVTIRNATGDYEIYQVFAGDYDNGKLSNVVWGKDVTPFEFTTKDAVGDETEEVKGTNASKIAEYLATKGADSAKVKDFAETAIKNLQTNSDGTTINSGKATAKVDTEDKIMKATFTGLAAGYYVVKNTEVANAESYTQYILQVVGNTTVNNKADAPTVEKKVKEKNDSTGTTSEWQDAADYDLNDDVPFQLTGTMPSNLDAYDTYSYTFTDTLSEGLTLNEKTVKVYLVDLDDEGKEKETEVTNGFKVSEATQVSSTNGSTKFTVSFADVKAIKGVTVTSESKFVVEYTAKLNKKAVIGSTGNPNTVDLTFSNNPNGTGKGKTPEDKVIVFTYKIVANKVNEDGNALKGAGFTLYKYDNTKKDYVAVGDEVKGEKITTFEFSRIDAGKYKLVETTVPSGFNKAEDLYFTVVTKLYQGDNPELKSLTIKDKNGTTVIDDSTNGTKVFTVNLSQGSATTTVVNKEGSLLPSTGGIGTTIFYVVGAVLMIGAGVILVSRRRTNK